MKNAIILISILSLFLLTSVTIAYSQEDVDLLIKKGIESYALGEYQTAISYFDKVLEIEPNNVKALNNKGGTLSILEKHEEAISYFDRALELEPNYVDAMVNKANSLSSLGEFDDAMLYLDRAIEIQPNNTSALNTKAIIYIEQSNVYDALTYFDKVFKINPDNEIPIEYIPLIKDYIPWKKVKGFIEFAVHDSQGNFIAYYKHPYLRVLEHHIAEDVINSWNVTSTGSFEGVDYEVRQNIFSVKMALTDIYATAQVPSFDDPYIQLVITGTWGYPINYGDRITALYTIFRPIE